MTTPTITLVGFASLMQPVTDFVANVSWLDGEPVDVLLREEALSHFGTDWHPNHPLWELLDALDLLNVNYGFAVSE